MERRDGPEQPWLTGDYVAPPGYRERNRGVDSQVLLVFTTAGQGVSHHGGEAVPLPVGSLLLLGPRTPHDYASVDGSWCFQWAAFEPRPWLAAWLARELDGCPGVFTFDGTTRERVRGALVYAHRDSCRLGPWSLNAGHEVGRTSGRIEQELVSRNLEEVLLLALRQRHDGLAPATDPRVAQVLRRLSENPAHRHDLAELATDVHLSPSRLRHLYKRERGESIVQTLLALRLRQAALLLELTAKRVGEVAYETGFGSPAYFTRQFTRRYGLSPTAYRIRAHASADGAG
jgi:AraC family transcriptional regulator, arabinose operon regulatory protein